MSVTVTVHGGAGEIGANKILIEDSGHDVKFFLDFGKSFEVMRQFYDFPISPLSLDELAQVKAIPEIANLYHDSQAKDPQDPDIDAVVLSHAHTDHSGYISLLNRKIAVHMGECTRRIFEARLEGSRRTFETNIEGLQIHTFKTGDTLRIGSVEILPVHVDHSIPAAYGFLIHLSEASLVYTGDFRRHGTRPEMTQDFIDAIQQAGRPDAVLSEGTNIAKAELARENEVKRKATEIVQSCKGLVIVDFSETDFDRFRTMQAVAQATGREIVIEPRRMWVLHAINHCRNLATPNIAKESSIHWFDAAKSRASKYERLLAENSSIKNFSDRTIKAQDLHAKPHKYLFSTSFGSISALQRVRPPASGIYLLSASEPFNEESEIGFDKLLNWLALSGLAMYSAHCSGHIHPLELCKTLEEMNPKLVIPIHTEQPELFQRFVKAGNIKTHIPKQGVSFTLPV